MKTALFTNYSKQPFTGFWDGKGKKFEPGQSLYMPDYLARHFALGLANRELIRLGKERATSPKFPEQVPDFMEQFNKAYTPDPENDEGEPGQEKDSIDTLINVANKNRESRSKARLPQGAEHLERKAPQIAEFPPDDGDDEEFGASPVESSPQDK